jgi:hypothetical protein
VETETKDQHYIPNLYLKGFTDKEGILWVCEKFKPIRPSKPKCEANRPDYYTHSEKGGRDETAEDVLKGVESRAATILRKIGNPQYVLTPENVSQLIVFVAFMFARVPSWREALDKVAGKVALDNHLKLASDRERFHALCSDYERSTRKPLGIDYEKLRQHVLNGDFKLIQKSVAFNLDAMFHTAFSLLEELKHFGYQALYAPEGCFYVTSDAPVFTLHPDKSGKSILGVGFGWRDTEVYFPLNKRACLRMKRGIEPMGRIVEAGRVAEINKILMITAAQHLYSSQSHRRIARLFDQHGCKIRAGTNAFMLERPTEIKDL